jgi:hypothetical protein
MHVGQPAEACRSCSTHHNAAVCRQHELGLPVYRDRFTLPTAKTAAAGAAVQRWLVGLPLNSKGLRVHRSHTVAVCVASQLQLILHPRSVCLTMTCTPSSLVASAVACTVDSSASWLQVKVNCAGQHAMLCNPEPQRRFSKALTAIAGIRVSTLAHAPRAAVRLCSHPRVLQQRGLVPS